MIVDAIIDFFEWDMERIELELCCLCAPSIAEIFFHEHGLNVTLLDIDTRFAYLPGFTYFDLTQPKDLHKTFSFIIFDPPYFGMAPERMATVVERLSTKATRHLIGFLRREQTAMVKAFAQFGIRETHAKVQYDRVRESRWDNYGLFSNCDLPGIKRMKIEKVKGAK